MRRKYCVIRQERQPCWIIRNDIQSVSVQHQRLRSLLYYLLQKYHCLFVLTESRSNPYRGIRKKVFYLRTMRIRFVYIRHRLRKIGLHWKQRVFRKMHRQQTDACSHARLCREQGRSCLYGRSRHQQSMSVCTFMRELRTLMQYRSHHVISGKEIQRLDIIYIILMKIYIKHLPLANEWIIFRKHECKLRKLKRQCVINTKNWVLTIGL